MIFNKMLQNLENKAKDKKLSKNMMLKPLRGNTSPYLDLFSGFISLKKSKRMIYIELYPLLNLILKSEKLMTEEQFDERKDYAYVTSYEHYKSARVKKYF